MYDYALNFVLFVGYLKYLKKDLKARKLLISYLATTLI